MMTITPPPMFADRAMKGTSSAVINGLTFLVSDLKGAYIVRRVFVKFWKSRSSQRCRNGGSSMFEPYSSSLFLGQIIRLSTMERNGRCQWWNNFRLVLEVILEMEHRFHESIRTGVRSTFDIECPNFHFHEIDPYQDIIDVRKNEPDDHPPDYSHSEATIFSRWLLTDRLALF